jgi:parallel beta-helix repeat protein
VPAVSAATAHDAISIDGNSGFTSANGVVSGTGTDLDQYIIEGWSINAPSSECITILNTDAYFIIRDCVLEFSGYGPHIKLDNVTNGRIEWNAISNNGNGIYLSHSSSNTIANNTSTRRYQLRIFLLHTIATTPSTATHLLSPPLHTIAKHISSTASASPLNLILSNNRQQHRLQRLFDIAIATQRQHHLRQHRHTSAARHRIYSSSGNQVTERAPEQLINAYDAPHPPGLQPVPDYTGGHNMTDRRHPLHNALKTDPHPIVLRPPAPDITSSPPNASVVPHRHNNCGVSSSSASINAPHALIVNE